jgi:hypothetical protein
VLTIVGGKVVYAVSGFSKLALPELPVSPAWSPVAKYGGVRSAIEISPRRFRFRRVRAHPVRSWARWKEGTPRGVRRGLWTLGCDCFAF